MLRRPPIDKPEMALPLGDLIVLYKESNPNTYLPG
jgi:hypothetical protein